MSTQMQLPLFQKASPTAEFQFHNRYSIHVTDLVTDKLVSISLMETFAHEIEAINPSIVFDDNCIYLTADKFNKVQNQLDRAFENRDFQIQERISATTTAYLIEVSSDLFYAGCPLQFWKEEDCKETDQDYQWGEISFTKVEEISGIDVKVAALEEVVVHFQQQLEDSPKWIRLEKAKKALSEAKKEQQEEDIRKKQQPHIQRLKDDGCECRTGHLVSSTLLNHWQTETGKNAYIYIVVDKNSSPIREVVDTGFEPVVLIGTVSSGETLLPEAVLGYGQTEEKAWSDALMGDYIRKLPPEEVDNDN